MPDEGCRMRAGNMLSRAYTQVYAQFLLSFCSVTIIGQVAANRRLTRKSRLKPTSNSDLQRPFCH